MLALLGLLSTAWAAEDSGSVLRIDGVELYVDLSVEDGLGPGQSVWLYRRVELQGPDGQLLEDPFLLGQGVAVEVGEQLALVRADPSVMLQLDVGDMVTLERLEPPRPVSRIEAVEPVSEEAWEAVQPECPEPAVVEVVPQPEVQTPAQAPTQAVVVEPIAFVQVGPEEILEGEPLRVMVSSAEIERVARGRLYFRREGEPGFRNVVMEPAGDAALAAEVPSEATVGTVQWYVLLEDEAGNESRGRFSGQRPATTLVSEDLPLSRPRQGRTELAVRYDWVDFYKLEGSDRMSRVEADVLYRLDRPLHAVRLGFGRWAGETRPMASFADPATSVSTGFHYGFLELELPLGLDWLSVTGRGMAGVYSGGLEGGVEGSLRVGPEEGTSLQASAGRIGPLGRQLGLGLAWNSVPRVPMRADVLVTNLPAANPQDYGVHLVWEGRSELTRWLELGLRLGYPLRAVHHSGLSAGGSMVLKW